MIVKENIKFISTEEYSSIFYFTNSLSKEKLLGPKKEREEKKKTKYTTKRRIVAVVI